MDKIIETHARDIMTKSVVTVSPETPITEASRFLVENEFNGLPVVDANRRVVGIITEYDLLSKGTAIHLPTFMKLFGDYPASQGDEFHLKGKFSDILKITVGEVMNADPLTLPEDATIVEVVEAFSRHHRVNPIPIVNAAGAISGIVSRFDVIKFYAKMLHEVGQVRGDVS